MGHGSPATRGMPAATIEIITIRGAPMMMFETRDVQISIGRDPARRRARPLLYKRDRPRAIDRHIDYFGGGSRRTGHAPTPRRWREAAARAAV
jgi:hypothetical protein